MSMLRILCCLNKEIGGVSWLRNVEVVVGPASVVRDATRVAATHGARGVTGRECVDEGGAEDWDGAVPRNCVPALTGGAASVEPSRRELCARIQGARSPTGRMATPP